jgi:hypothetical protein
VLHERQLLARGYSRPSRKPELRVCRDTSTPTRNDPERREGGGGGICRG